jgi:hypothetical protein
VAHTQRAFQQEVENPEPCPVAKTFVDFNQLHDVKDAREGIFSDKNVA